MKKKVNKDMTINQTAITLSLVYKLVSKQFPQWADLPIRDLEFSSVDNKTFLLGDELLVRLPSDERYATQVSKEQKWLPRITPHLSIKIPEPIVKGQPSSEYPWHWSIYKWIDGESANSINIELLDLNNIAEGLAQFLNELHAIPIEGGPLPGSHNFYRGAHPSIYEEEVKWAIMKLEDWIDSERAIAVWEQAMKSQWNQDPVWIHGDFSDGNILIKDEKLAAVIDFGCMGVGDPACDLVIAWTFLKDKSRKIFRECVNLDQDTWARARGWALWKACIELVVLQDKEGIKSKKLLEIIDVIIKDFECFK